MLDVCLAVIRSPDGKVLAARHAKGSRHAGFWEFPGGKLESDETPEQCIVREIYEELGVHIQVVKTLGIFEYPHNLPPLRMHAFLCDLIEGRPRALEHDMLLWLKPESLTELNWLEVDYEILACLQRDTSRVQGPL